MFVQLFLAVIVFWTIAYITASDSIDPDCVGEIFDKENGYNHPRCRQKTIDSGSGSSDKFSPVCDETAVVAVVASVPETVKVDSEVVARDRVKTGTAGNNFDRAIVGSCRESFSKMFDAAVVNAGRRDINVGEREINTDSLVDVTDNTGNLPVPAYLLCLNVLEKVNMSNTFLFAWIDEGSGKPMFVLRTADWQHYDLLLGSSSVANDTTVSPLHLRSRDELLFRDNIRRGTPSDLRHVGVSGERLHVEARLVALPKPMEDSGAVDQAVLALLLHDVEGVLAIVLHELYCDRSIVPKVLVRISGTPATAMWRPSLKAGRYFEVEGSSMLSLGDVNVASGSSSMDGSDKMCMVKLLHDLDPHHQGDDQKESKRRYELMGSATLKLTDLSGCSRKRIDLGLDQAEEQSHKCHVIVSTKLSWEHNR